MVSKELVTEAFVDALKSVVGIGPTALHEPIFGEAERSALMSCLDSTFVSSVGEYVGKFENLVSEFTGSPFAVAVVNGTAALHIGLVLAGVRSQDEVLIPAFTFAATANAVTYLGAVPHFVDINRDTFGIDPEYLKDWLAHSAEVTTFGCRNKRTGRKIAALIPVHVFGHCCDLDPLLAIAKDYKLEILEDAAEALGSYYRGRHAGTIARFGILSFNGNKIITTGGGGMLLTPDKEIATVARHITTTAKINDRWNFVHDQVGYNYRMPNLNAALGCAQMERLDMLLDSKQRLTELYRIAFQKFNILGNVGQLRTELDNQRCNYWLQTFVFTHEYANILEEVLSITNSQGISTRPPWKPLSLLRHFSGCPSGPLPVTYDLSSRTINIPSSPGIAL